MFTTLLLNTQTYLLYFYSDRVSNIIMGCIQLFVELGIDPNLKTKQGDTALNLLCQSSTGKGLLDCVRVLVEKLGLHPDCKNENGENSLHCLFKSKLIRNTHV